MSLMITISKGSSSKFLTIVSDTSEPTGPLILSTASDKERPRIASPSTWVIKSPDCIPASDAGVPSIGETTLTNPSSWVTSIPKPPKAPFVSTCISSKFSGGI